jgi:threonine/homoserine/homoserine lactone efflux protein
MTFVLTFFKGIVLGLTVCFLIGPSFFALLQTSIHRGFKSGFFLCLGIVISDFTLIALSYIGALQILDNAKNQFTIGIVGGIILVAFGVYTFTRKIFIAKDEVDDDIRVKTPRPITYILKGYFTNIANPFLLIFWIGTMGLVSSQYEIGTNSVIIFFTGTLVTIFTTDIAKCFVANKLKQYLKPNILHWINYILGVALVLSGIILIIRVVCYF